jgi:2-dehydropantoate 2-reductase
MKVSVIGAGAIGAMVGGLLRRDAADLEVQLIVRGEHGRVVGERGSIRLDGPWGTAEVPIASNTDIAAIAGSEVVIITVKSQDTESAAQTAAPFLDGATVVSIQNGINGGRLATHIDPAQLVMGMTATNMAVVEPGRVSLQLGGATVLGSPQGRDNGTRVRQAVDLLQQIRCPQLSFHAHENVLGVRYNKLAVNALGYASCLSASNFITEALSRADWRAAVGFPLIRECRRVFDRAGIQLERIPGVPSLARLERFMRLMGAPVLGPIVTLGARRLFNRRPIVFSLEQDLRRRKSTEVAYVNGEVVRLARSIGAAAPANELVMTLVRELEQRGDGTFFAPNEVIERFARLPDARAAA